MMKDFKIHLSIINQERDYMTNMGYWIQNRKTLRKYYNMEVMKEENLKVSQIEEHKF
jgi:hypothetical protein